MWFVWIFWCTSGFLLRGGFRYGLKDTFISFCGHFVSFFCCFVSPWCNFASLSNHFVYLCCFVFLWGHFTSLSQNISSLYTEAMVQGCLGLYPVDQFSIHNANKQQLRFQGVGLCHPPVNPLAYSPVPATCIFHHIFSEQRGPAKIHWEPCEFCIYLSIYSVNGGAVSSGPLVSGRDRNAGC